MKVEDEAQQFLENLFSAENSNLNWIIKNIPYETTADELIEILKLPLETITKFKLMRGYAFVSLSIPFEFQENIQILGRTLSFEIIKEEWMCPCGLSNYDSRMVCRCGLERGYEYVNGGEMDISQTPTSIVLLQDLHPELTAKDLFDTVGDQDGILAILVMMDKPTRSSLKFGFIPFANPQSSASFMAYYRQGLDVKGPITLSYSSLSAFVPGEISGYTSYIQDGISFQYWDGNTLTDCHPPLDLPPIQEHVDRTVERKPVFIGPVITRMKNREFNPNWKSVEVGQQSLDGYAVERYIPSTSALDQEYTDVARMRCLLCRRKFVSVEGLRFHLEGKMHAQRIRIEKGRRRGLVEEDIKNGVLKEKRVRYSTNPKQKTVMATRNGIKDDNIGNRMLKGMGWREGMGLGARNDGIRDNVVLDGNLGRSGIGRTRESVATLKSKR